MRDFNSLVSFGELNLHSDPSQFQLVEERLEEERDRLRGRGHPFGNEFVVSLQAKFKDLN